VPEYGDASNILLTTVLDEHGKRQGVLAQLLQNSATEQCLPLSGLSDLTDDNEATQTKPSQAQQRSNPKADSHQTQLFRTFAEIVPNGLAILDMNAEAVFVNDNFFKLTTNKSAKGFRAWPESIHPNDFDRVISMYRNAFKSRDELRVEFRCACDNAGEDQGEDGEWRLFLLRPLSEDSEAGYICAVVDITEIKQAQLSQEKAATDARDRKEQQERFIDSMQRPCRSKLKHVLITALFSDQP
jgi:PAS domain S-box-containing protein